jgi:hypothetical protein
MNKADLRAEQRISVSCRGTLSAGDTPVPCLIQNMCSRGFLIKFSKDLPVGQMLQLKCELDPARTVECKVQVRHINPECLGARVVEISDDGRILCRKFLEERAS